MWICELLRAWMLVRGCVSVRCVLVDVLMSMCAFVYAYVSEWLCERMSERMRVHVCVFASTCV